MPCDLENKPFEFGGFDEKDEETLNKYECLIYSKLIKNFKSDINKFKIKQINYNSRGCVTNINSS
jgi:hypothetical protein